MFNLSVGSAIQGCGNMQKFLFQRASIVCAAVFAVGGALTAPCLSAPQTNAADKVVKPLKAILGTFRVSKTPVLLPSWSDPAWNKLPIGISSGPFKDGYEYSFGTSGVDTLFYGSGGIGTAQKGKRHVQLGAGRDAVMVQMRNDMCLEWQEGKYVYRLGVPSNPMNEPDLIKAAKSLVLVPQSAMQDAPRGDDLLLKALESDKEMHESSNRSLIGQKLEQGIDAAAGGNYKKAELLYRELIAKWQKCEEMAPMHEIQLALAQTLTKLGRAGEAEQIKTKFANDIKQDEQARKKVVEDSSAKLATLEKGSADYERERAWLGNKRAELAKLYFVEGRFDEAEALLKTGFQDIATCYGRGAADARSIADEYALLLRSAGKSTEPAKKLLQPGQKGHSPVTLTLSPASGLKKMGADSVVLVVEDEYGAPSGDQWFTKKVWLEGMKGDKVVWKKAVKMNDFVNMDKCTVSCSGTTFTIDTTLGGSRYAHKFAWDGNNVKLKETHRTDVK